jgi:hypothetical protein
VWWPYTQSVCWYYCRAGRIYSLYVGTTVVLAAYTVCKLVLLSCWPYIQPVGWYYCRAGRIYSLYVGTTVVLAYIQSVCWYYCRAGRIYSLYVDTTVVVAVYTGSMLVLLSYWPYIQTVCWYYCRAGLHTVCMLVLLSCWSGINIKQNKKATLLQKSAHFGPKWPPTGRI